MKLGKPESTIEVQCAPPSQRALAICEKVLGPEHFGTAASLDNFAVLLQSQGDLAAARPLFERALAIREKVLGPEHPDTNRGRHNFARLLLADGKAAEALRFSEAALSAHENALGKTHRWTKDSARDDEGYRQLNLASGPQALDGVHAGVAADALACLGRAEEASALRGRYDVLQFGFDQTDNDTQLLRT